MNQQYKPTIMFHGKLIASVYKGFNMWKTTFRPYLTGQFSIIFCLLLLSAITASSINAASLEKNTTTTISLKKAIEKTIQFNPKLKTFDSEIKAYKARIQKASVAPPPELSLEVADILGTGNNTGIGNTQATLSIAWVIERGIRQQQIQTARSELSFNQVKADIAQLNAAAETARLYISVLAFQAKETTANKTMQLAEEIIKSIQKRVKAGKTPEAELSRAQAELARRKLEREDITHGLISASRRLAAQWGETMPSFSRVVGDITFLPKVSSFDVLKSQLSKNPKLIQLASKQLVQKEMLKTSIAKNRPNWKVNAGIRHMQNGNDQAFVIGMSIPFGERTRNPGRIAEAQANLEKLTSEEHATRIRIETSLFVLNEELLHSLHIIETVRNNIIPPLESALVETRRAYNLGRYSYLELRSVQTELLQAQNALIEASIDAHQNIINIEQLTGIRIVKIENKI